MREGLKKLALALAIGSASTGVVAFTDGTLGADSTGDFDIRLLINQQARIWGFQDMVFTTAAANETANQNICLYSNSQRVSLKVTSNFQLTDGAETMDYELAVKGISAGDGVIGSGGSANPATVVTWANSGADNTSGQTHTLPFAAQNSEDTNCSGNENLNVAITFKAPSGAFSDGTYTDTVTMTVEPQ